MNILDPVRVRSGSQAAESPAQTPSPSDIKNKTVMFIILPTVQRVVAPT